MSFSADNSLAKFYENLYINCHNFDAVLLAPDKQFKDWDVVFQDGDTYESSEIKADRNVVNTGNLSIELFSFSVKGGGYKEIENSGLSATKAEYFVIFAHNTFEWWVIPTSWLKHYISRHKPSGAGWFGDKIATVNIPIRNQKAQEKIQYYIPPTRDSPAFTEGGAYNFLYPKSAFNHYKQKNWNEIISTVKDYREAGEDLPDNLTKMKYNVVVKFIECGNVRPDAVYLVEKDADSYNDVKNIEYDGHTDIPAIYTIKPESFEEEERTLTEIGEREYERKRGK